MLSAVAVRFSVSVPAPPSTESPELSVVMSVPVTEVADALMISSPFVPTTSSIPVVSDQIWYFSIFNLFSDLDNDTVGILCATYRIPTLRRR